MRLMVVTDLDGTLLDHATYSYAPAEPALALLKARGIPLVIASSKTAAEMRPLHAALGLGDTPAIVENGAGLLRSGQEADIAADYAEIRRVLAATKAARHFQGFGDMNDAEVAQITGLPLENATLARQRVYSEPGLWHGTAKEEATFVAALAQHGIQARRGGRFLTLSYGRTKADALASLRTELAADRVIALGDAPNDIEMLEAADHGVIIRNDHGTDMPPLAGEATGRIQRSTEPGPTGWNSAVSGLLRDILPEHSGAADG